MKKKIKIKREKTKEQQIRINNTNNNNNTNKYIEGDKTHREHKQTKTTWHNGKQETTGKNSRFKKNEQPYIEKMKPTQTKTTQKNKQNDLDTH